ncbi:uncharacterized protein [Fopius arisanus]|uniref:Gamma-aminobutyric acid type B receptor subunit 2 n=1 Tax=Fopius arisanus TaxID=64838 RepID=A0A9R1TWI9_9HYME|nr:PREDICTED: uncharacterized protein LOC105264073 [Fopius arisanus]XP_011298959.1 PREDICTED: uncharacterized protein LOC105264073 [Fopius arisanus]
MQGYGKIIVLLVIVGYLRPTSSNQCLKHYPEMNPKRVVYLDGQSLTIPFELTQRATQRLATRVMRIFLMEVLGYADVTLKEPDDVFDITSVFIKMAKSFDPDVDRWIPETMVNMEVWISPQTEATELLNQFDVKECGPICSTGRIGWFVPEELSRFGENWRIFANRETAERFSVDNDTLQRIQKSSIDPVTGKYYCEASFCTRGMYIPPQCLAEKTQSCAVLLTSETNITQIVKEHIDQLKLFVKVIWVGPNLQKLTTSLTKEYAIWNKRNDRKKSLVMLHWTPSEIIPNERQFIAIDLPRCGSGDLRIGCTYETNRLVKLAWSKLESIAKFAWEAINRSRFYPYMYEDLIDRYNRLSGNQTEDDVACGWLRDNLNYTLEEWMPNSADKNTLYIGGIFPMSGINYRDKSILLAAKMAKEAINNNSTILRDYNMVLLANDGQCTSDRVMKSFIDYIFHNYYEKLVGVLGPACTETVEPLVGVSKHYRTVIISYGADGSSFDDRSKYPYFFRTIGENKQYRYVYLQLLKSFGWKRVAALTEDGQKYTEYISYMQDLLRDKGIDFIANIKFPRERENNQMTQYLLDLKRKRARIIIADVYDTVARQIMCQAYKLQMMPAQGYVWFLNLWLRSNWYDTDYHNKYSDEKVPCNTTEMVTAINGHLGISHAYVAPDDNVIQTGETVATWRDSYEQACRKNNETPSIHAAYAYDAMWTYAYAMDRLIRENQSYVVDLHSEKTVKRLTRIIEETDFNGVSGHIKFFGGASRVSVINIMQRINNKIRMVGNFYPEVSPMSHEIIGGQLILNKSEIVWLSESTPDDGSEPPVRCILGDMPELLNVSCEAAIVIVNVIGVSLLVVLLIIGFIIVKRKYDAKVRQHEKVMESFGLDPRHTTSGLDKWEVPRDRVVINRKLGEGAFGTVYGGEAFFPEKGWLAVAVKTLKTGSSTEEKLDFLSEVEVMKRFEHKNIIKLLGVCIKSAPVLTVMEFMLYGDLKTYLLARRHLVNDQNYEDSDEISTKKLTGMALDVARALSYLAQMKYIHRDVASRNCLVNAQRVVKLGDFGMTRPMYENDYYKFNRKGMLPVRWMAPESLGLGIFTPASDVWSFGVLLYEIITFGSFPFQGMSNNEVLGHVKAGNSLRVPKGVKPTLEGLIKSCWAVDHSKRPTAPEIVDFLATNPRLLSPCLDVPLASVQLESSRQLDFPGHDNITKFSLQLAWPMSRRQTVDNSGKIISDSTNTPLLDIHQENNVDTPMRHDGQLPLLSGESSALLQPINVKPEDIPRYVNLQPRELKVGNGRGGLQERNLEDDIRETEGDAVF